MEARDVAAELEQILRLDTRPVGVKLYNNRDELPTIPFDHKVNICQLIAMARYQGEESCGVPDKMICSMGAACTGLIETPNDFTSGAAAVGPYCKDEETGMQFMANTFKLGDSGKHYDSIYVAPLENSRVEPDVVVIYANPAQVMRLIHACTYDNGQKVTADTVAEAALCSSIGYVIANDKPVIGFPCAGDRIFGGTQHTELVFAAPYSMLDKLVENLERTAEGGFSVYPVPPYMMWTPAMPMTYTIQPEHLKK